MSKTFQLNIPISKIDEEQRTVTGIATNETLDSQGDIVDYEASKKAFSEWVGNIREMHNPISIGKAIDVQFDDDNKQVIITAKISKSADGENAWIKVKEGILQGFSIGGRVFKVAKDKAVNGANRVIDYALSETSLVDNPANPDAMFMMVKSVDGKLELEGAEMQKSVWDAAQAVNMASELVWLIMSENREGEPDQVADLMAAFNALKDFVAKEVIEGDEFDSAGYSEVIEMAQTAIDLRKDKSMSEEITKGGVAVVGEDARDDKAAKVAPVVNGGEAVKVGKVAEKAAAPIKKSTNVIGGVERDENAEIVNDERPENAVETAVEPVVGVADAPSEIEVTAATVVPVEKPVVEEVTEPVVADEAPAADDTKEEAKDEKKGDTATDLVKTVETLLAKLNEGQGMDLKKVSDAVADLGAKVEKSFTSLEERLSAVEAQPLPIKTKASYHVVEKGGEVVADEMEALTKRQNELIANPGDAKPGEMYDLAMKIRKANSGERIEIK